MTTDVLIAPEQLATLDIPELNAARLLLKQQLLSLSAIYLPALQEKLSALLSELADSDKRTLNALTAIPAVLKSDGLPDLVASLVTLREEAMPSAAAAVQAITLELNAELQSKLARVEEEAGRLSDALHNLEAITLSDADSAIARLQEDIAPLKARLDEQEKPLAELQEQEKSLNKLIDEVEAISILDKLKPLVEGLQALAEVDPKNPLVGSIKAGLEGIKNQLNIGSEAIRYQDLITLRSRLQSRQDTLGATLRDLRDRLAEDESRLKQLNQFQGLGQPRSVYLVEVGKLAQELKLFAEQNQIDGAADIVKQVPGFITSAETLTGFLNDLRRTWQN